MVVGLARRQDKESYSTGDAWVEAWVVQECWGHATSQWVGDDVTTCTGEIEEEGYRDGQV